MNGGFLTAAPPGVRDRAIAAQRRHAEILSRITPEALGADEFVRLIRDQADDLQHEYIAQELQILGVDIPANLSPVDPDHAIVLAVRRDMIDTRDAMDRMLSVRSDRRFFDKQPQTIAEAIVQGAGNTAKDARDLLRQLADSPFLIVSIVIGIVSVFITLLVFLKG